MWQRLTSRRVPLCKLPPPRPSACTFPVDVLGQLHVTAGSWLSLSYHNNIGLRPEVCGKSFRQRHPPGASTDALHWLLLIVPALSPHARICVVPAGVLRHPGGRVPAHPCRGGWSSVHRAAGESSSSPPPATRKPKEDDSQCHTNTMCNAINFRLPLVLRPSSAAALPSSLPGQRPGDVGLTHGGCARWTWTGADLRHLRATRPAA